MPTTSPRWRRSGWRRDQRCASVAIFTDSASDLDPTRAAAEGISIVPLLVTFGADTYKAGVDMSTVEFWDRMTAPDAPFPKTAAASPGRLQGGVRGRLRGGRRVRSSWSTSRARCRERSRAPRSHATCCPTARSTSSIRRARRWSRGSSREMAVELADDGVPAAEIAQRLEARTGDLRVYLALETLDYLKKRRPDQRRPGGDRHAAVGQADHRGHERRGRDGRQGPDPLQGARAARSS